MIKIETVKKNIFTRLFNSLYRTNKFGQIIAICLLIGLVSILNFRKTIKESVRTRLENRLEIFTNAVNENITNHATTLSFVDAYFRSEKLPETERLNNFLSHIDAEHLNHDIDRIEYIDFNLKAPTTLRDDKFEKEAITAAMSSGKISISRPMLYSKTVGSSRKQLQRLAMYLPYYGTRLVPKSREERLKKIKGMLYIPINLNEFFETKYGKAYIDNENVNFRIEFIDTLYQKVLAYERFTQKIDYRYLENSRVLNVYGQRLLITATTLPEFFFLSERFLPNILFAVFILMLILSIGIFYQTQNLLHQEKKANDFKEESNKVKEAFLSNMSHEIRTPLNAISGFSKILSHSANENEKQYLIEGIRKNTTELTNFIENILDISKIEFGRIVINKKYINLLTIIERIKTTMENRAHSKGLLFEIEALSKLPIEIDVDEARVKQILINLIGNAIKFTERGYIKLQIEAQNSGYGQTHLMFTIIDTGIGISSSGQLELFQSFSQIDYSNTRRYGGIGLGLALSRRLAQQLNGEVTLLESQIEKGSVFRLRIPCGNLQNVKWQDNLFMQLSGPMYQLDFLGNLKLDGLKILIVEDSKDNQNIFNYFLTTAGAETAVAENGQIAVEMVTAAEYDVILMDIQMPVLDGMAATRKIRELGFKNPIIALTAHASVEAKLNCLEAGCVDLITKPVTGDILIKRINLTLEEYRYGAKDNYT